MGINITLKNDFDRHQTIIETRIGREAMSVIPSEVMYDVIKMISRDFIEQEGAKIIASIDPKGIAKDVGEAIAKSIAGTVQEALEKALKVRKASL